MPANNTLTNKQKKRILELFEKITKDINILKKKGESEFNTKITDLEEKSDILKHYRTFKSPRRILGKLLDKVRGKFYYETQHFVGDIFAHQEKFNSEVIKYLQKLSKEVDSIKKQIKK